MTFIINLSISIEIVLLVFFWYYIRFINYGGRTDIFIMLSIPSQEKGLFSHLSKFTTSLSFKERFKVSLRDFGHFSLGYS